MAEGAPARQSGPFIIAFAAQADTSVRPARIDTTPREALPMYFHIPPQDETRG